MKDDPFDWQTDPIEQKRLDEEAAKRNADYAAELAADPAYVEYAEQRDRDFNFINAAIDPVQSYGLSTEILYWAMGALKSNPKMSIAEAIQYGFYEWVK